MEKILISCLSQDGTAWLREEVLHDPRELSGRVGGPFFPTAPLKTEQEIVFCSYSVFIGMLCHIPHATGSPVSYGALTSHLITSVINRILNISLLVMS